MTTNRTLVSHERANARLQLSAASWARGARLPFLMTAAGIVGALAVGAATAERAMLGVGAAAGLGLGLIIVRRLELGGLILVTLVPVLSGLERGFPVPKLKVTELLTVSIAGIVFCTIRQIHARPWTKVELTLTAFVALYFGLGLVDAKDLGNHLGISDYGTLLGPLQFLLLYRCIRLVLPARTLQRQALRLFIYLSVPVSAIAMMQEVNVPGVRGFIARVTASYALAPTSGGSSSYLRATGPFPQWTLLAGYLTVIIVLLLALLMEREIFLLPRRRAVIILLIDSLGLLLSAEISAIFGIVVAVVILAVWAKRTRVVFKYFALSLVLFATVAGSFLLTRLHQEYDKATGQGGSHLVPQTIQFRLNIWINQYFPAIGLRPLSGYGGVLPPSIKWQVPESQYVAMLIHGGAPLLLSFIVMMGALAVTGKQLGWDAHDAVRRVTGRSLLVLVIILVPMDFVFPYFEDSGLPQALWVLVGIMMSTVPGRLGSSAAGPALVRGTGQPGEAGRVELLPVPGFEGLPCPTPEIGGE
jgi:hypothetical protein